MSIEMSVESMRALGFEKCGEWALVQEDRLRLRCNLEQHDLARTVYAFLVDDELVYIGIPRALTSTLMSRMKRYEGRFVTPQVPPGSTTRNAALISDAVNAGRRVFILATNPNQIPAAEGDSDPVKTFEAHLIQELQPLWNRQGKRVRP